MKGCYQGRLGLTLIELLLVIGIIAVLAGICWMAYGAIKEKALLVICRNNFRQIYLAVSKYSLGRRLYLYHPKVFLALGYCGLINPSFSINCITPSQKFTTRCKEPSRSSRVRPV